MDGPASMPSTRATERATDEERLRVVLETAQARGFIGAGDLGPHLDHAVGFAQAFMQACMQAGEADEAFSGSALDLGSGGGLPGLVLALHWPGSRWTLLDANEKRTHFLAEAVERLALADRVSVLRGRAESLAREPAWRSQFDLVVARSFGPPAVVAECAAGFLAARGRLVVSEPPGSAGERWNHPASLATLGFELQGEELERSGAGRFQVLVCVGECDDRYPRRVGVPAKRPLF